MSSGVCQFSRVPSDFELGPAPSEAALYFFSLPLALPPVFCFGDSGNCFIVYYEQTGLQSLNGTPSGSHLPWQQACMVSLLTPHLGSEQRIGPVIVETAE